MHAPTRRPISALIPLLLVLAAVAAPGITRPAAASVVQSDGVVASPLRVAIKTAPPFVMRNPAGELEGISVDLWERVAARLGRDTTFVELDSVPEMLAETEAGTVDAAIAAISITPEREVSVDLSHGYHLAGLGIAVQRDALGRGGLLSSVRNLISPQFLAAVGALAVVLMVVGVLIWLAERRGNADHFPPDAARGIGNGFWFSAVTMTTVGYGDRAPATLPGRLIALVWMFASIIVISAFTGSIASSLTAARFEGGVQSADDLGSVRVGVVAGTTAVNDLRDRGVVAVTYPDVAAGLDALAADELDAFVHDQPILVHGVNTEHAGELAVLPVQFSLTSYAIAMPPGSELTEDVNRAILEITRDANWQVTLRRYLGDQG
jgi:ABC-type amino acid transport substrate-binding protein